MNRRNKIMQTIAEPAIIVGNNDPMNSILKSQDYYFSLDFKTAENELGKVKDYLRDNGVSHNTPAIQTTKERVVAMSSAALQAVSI